MTPRLSTARIASIAMGVSTSGVLTAFLLGALAPQLQRELGFGDGALGASYGLYFAMGGLLAIPAGRLADRIGWQRSVRIAAVGCIIALLGVAGFARSYTSLLAFMAVGGLSMSLTGPTGNLVIVREVAPARHGFMFGLKQASTPAATLLAGASVPVLALTVGWRWAYVGAALIPATVAYATPRRHTNLARTSRGREALRAPHYLVLLAVGGGLAMGMAATLSSFLVLSLVGSGMAEGTAGVVLMAASVAGLATRLGAGAVADRRPKDVLRLVRVLLSIGVIGYALLATRTPALQLLGALLAYGAGWGWPGLLFLAATREFPATPASASGVLQVGMASGTALGPLAFGLISEAAGYPTAWLATAVAAAGSVIVMGASSRALSSRGSAV